MERKVKKILITGSAGSGKSSILRCILDRSFQSSYIATMGIDFEKIDSACGNYIMNVWDASERGKFGDIIRNNYYGSTDILVVVFDVTDLDSMAFVDFVLQNAKKLCRADTEMLLIGTKADMSDRKVSVDQAEVYALEHGMCYLDFSSLNSSSTTILAKLHEVVKKHDC